MGIIANSVHPALHFLITSWDLRLLQFALLPAVLTLEILIRKRNRNASKMNGEKRKLPKPSCLGTYPSWSGTREEKLWSCCVHIFGLMPPKQKRGCTIGRRTHAFTSHLILFVLVYKQTSSQTICEVVLPVYVIAPVLGTTVGTDSWNPGLKAVCSQSCRVALGPRVEIKYLSKSACGAQKGAEWRIWTFWGWQRTEAGECRWW